MTGHTQIAGRDIPIHGGDLITIVFAGGPNPGDASEWDFWVLFNEKSVVPARWRHGEDPGKRYREMDGKAEYAEQWEVARTALGIRPATREQVKKWLKDHPKEASFAQTYSTMKITTLVKADDTYRLD